MPIMESNLLRVFRYGYGLSKDFPACKCVGHSRSHSRANQISGKQRNEAIPQIFCSLANFLMPDLIPHYKEGERRGKARESARMRGQKSER
ncbi:hypothetical protein MHYP_G00326900 [Metynnis hypsauchen]